MKKINALFTLLMVVTMALTGCTLPMRGTTPPSPDSSSGSAAEATPTTASLVDAAPTDSGILPSATAPPAITDTPLSPAAYPPPATAVPLIPSATPLPAASRVLFSSGATTATVDGSINAGQTLYYVVQGAAGQTLEVEVWSPNEDVYLGVTAATTGETLLSAALHDANWTGSLPATQDYYLSITAGGGNTTYAVTIELTPLVGSAATGTPLATPVAGLFDPYALFGRPDFEDPMTGSSVSDWEDEDGELPDTEYIRLAVRDARFYVTGKLAGFSTWYFTWRELSDFYLQATFDSGSCSGQDAYGLIIRGPAHMAGVSYGYVISFTCDGKLWVFRLDGADPFTATDLVSLTPSAYINAGANQRNLLGIQAVGDTLTIFANGHQIAQVVDARYDFGRIGVFVSPQWTPFYTYRVVNLAYWELDD
jgi:hypothetical protein